MFYDLLANKALIFATLAHLSGVYMIIKGGRGSLFCLGFIFKTKKLVKTIYFILFARLLPFLILLFN